MKKILIFAVGTLLVASLLGVFFVGCGQGEPATTTTTTSTTTSTTTTTLDAYYIMGTITQGEALATWEADLMFFTDPDNMLNSLVSLEIYSGYPINFTLTTTEIGTYYIFAGAPAVNFQAIAFYGTLLEVESDAVVAFGGPPINYTPITCEGTYNLQDLGTIGAFVLED